MKRFPSLENCKMRMGTWFEDIYIWLRYREPNQLQSAQWNGLTITETLFDPYVKRIAFQRMGCFLEQERIFRALLHKESSTLIDVGANIGVITLLLAKINGATVYAFEPVSRSYECLKRNLRQNSIDNVKAFNFGMSDSSKHLFIGPPSGFQHLRYKSDNLKTGLFSIHASQEGEEAKGGAKQPNLRPWIYFAAR